MVQARVCHSLLYILLASIDRYGEKPLRAKSCTVRGLWGWERAGGSDIHPGYLHTPESSVPWDSIAGSVFMGTNKFRKLITWVGLGIKL